MANYYQLVFVDGKTGAGIGTNFNVSAKTGQYIIALPPLSTYLISKGIGSVEAEFMQDMINVFLSIYTGGTTSGVYAAAASGGALTKVDGVIYPDATMVTMWEKFAKYIFDVAVGSFIGYSANGSLITTHPTDAEVETWIGVNRPDIDSAGTGTVGAAIADIVVYDLNTVIVPIGNTPALATGDPQVPDNPVNIYANLVSGTLETITRYLRTVTGTCDLTSRGGYVNMPNPTKDISANSSSYGGTNVPLLPDVTL